jgi:hypothetical protein
MVYSTPFSLLDCAVLSLTQIIVIAMTTLLYNHIFLEERYL